MLIEVSESSQAGEARRRAVEYAQDAQMDEKSCGAVALATTEMATNLLKHAGRGHILLQRLQANDDDGLRIISVDNGPGISNISRALFDGHSTAGTMGTGLGAIRRLSNSFDIYSKPGLGTVVSSEFWLTPKKHTKLKSAIQVGVVSEPMPGEDVCGDGWGIRIHCDSLIAMVVDGLGHGVLAAEAAREAELVLAKTSERSPHNIVRETHDALKKTRGAAFGVTKIDASKGLILFAGVGNIATSIVAPDNSRSLASHNGILGQNMQRVQEFSVPWIDDSILVMHSDGLMTRWDLQQYPGICNKPPSLIAAVLHRDFCRKRDDVTVLVAKAAVV